MALPREGSAGQIAAVGSNLTGIVDTDRTVKMHAAMKRIVRRNESVELDHSLAIIQEGRIARR